MKDMKKALGGKVSMGESSLEHQQELQRFQEFKNEMNSLAQVNSEENAFKLRQVMVKHHPRFAQTFRALNLAF